MRRHLAAALDHMEELAAMLLAMAEQAHNRIGKGAVLAAPA